MFAVSGNIIEPKKKNGDFSHDNWSDYTTPVVENGVTVTKKVVRSTIFKRRIDGLSAKHWDMILKTATPYMGSKKKTSTVIVIEEGEEEVQAVDGGFGEEYDMALRDPMFD